jgi:hypothetical protein
MATTTDRKDDAMNTLTPVTAQVIWHDDAAPFAFVDHQGESFTLCKVQAGIDIYRDIEGDACRIGQTDTQDEALELIMHHTYQLIDC